jgi:hypothetical protein
VDCDTHTFFLFVLLLLSSLYGQQLFPAS